MGIIFILCWIVGLGFYIAEHLEDRRQRLRTLPLRQPDLAPDRSALQSEWNQFVLQEQLELDLYDETGRLNRLRYY